MSNASVSIEDRISEDLKVAMRNGDTLRRSVLRLIRSQLQYEFIKRGREPLADEDVILVVSQMVRQYKETIAIYQSQNRTDLAEGEENELSIVMEYMPSQLSREELLTAVVRKVQELGISGPSAKGKVMAQIMPDVKGRADGSLVGAVVDEVLGVS